MGRRTRRGNMTNLTFIIVVVTYYYSACTFAGATDDDPFTSAAYAVLYDMMVLAVAEPMLTSFDVSNISMENSRPINTILRDEKRFDTIK